MLYIKIVLAIFAYFAVGFGIYKMLYRDFDSKELANPLKKNISHACLFISTFWPVFLIVYGFAEFAVHVESCIFRWSHKSLKSIERYG